MQIEKRIKTLEDNIAKLKQEIARAEVPIRKLFTPELNRIEKAFARAKASHTKPDRAFAA